MTASDDRRIESAVQVLRELGPLSTEELTGLSERGALGQLDDPRDLIDLLDHPNVGQLLDGRSIAVDTILDGRVFTHRLTGEDLELSWLTFLHGLFPLADMFARSRVPEVRVTSEWGEVACERMNVHDFEVEILVLPAAAVDKWSPGQVVGLEVRGDVLTLVEVEPEDIGDLAALLRGIVGENDEYPVNPVIWQAVLEEPSLFTRPLLPMDELLAASGFDVQGDSVARQGFDRKAHRAAVYEEYLAAAGNLNAGEAAAVSAFIDLVVAAADTSDSELERLVEERREQLSMLTSDGVWSAVQSRSQLLGLPSANVESAARAVGRRGPRGARAGGYWLAGKTALLDGKAESAERFLEDALGEDAESVPVLDELARFAAWRGDAERAVRLIERTPYAAEDPLHEYLQQFLAADRPEIGRNDRCWCGSGRKYKVCHLGKSELTVGQHATWLHQKASLFMQESGHIELLKVLVQERARHWTDSQAMLRAFDDGVVVDIVLSEGGVFAEFLRVCGPLLPEIEQMMAAQWLLAERSVFDVLEVRPGEGLTLQDLRTGDNHEVVERKGSRTLQAGMYICTRVLPVGEQWQLFGGIEPVDPARRVDLMAVLDHDESADKMVALVVLLSERFAPVEMVTPGGQALVFCTAVFAVDDAKPLRRKLSRRYGKGESDEWTWLEGTAVRGRLRLDKGDDGRLELTVEASTVPRFEALHGAVWEMDPGAELIEERRESANEMARSAGAKPAPRIAQAPAAPEPELAAVLDEYILAYEKSWLDEQIPALGSVTPRQAAADPTRRDDLVRLLASFPQDDAPGMMSVRRLRKMLGL